MRKFLHILGFISLFLLLYPIVEGFGHDPITKAEIYKKLWYFHFLGLISSALFIIIYIKGNHNVDNQTLKLHKK